MNNRVHCWGGLIPELPAGMYKAISAGSFLCGIRLDDTIACSATARAPSGEFRSLSVGDGHMCGVRINREVVWPRREHNRRPQPFQTAGTTRRRVHGGQRGHLVLLWYKVESCNRMLGLPGPGFESGPVGVSSLKCQPATGMPAAFDRPAGSSAGATTATGRQIIQQGDSAPFRRASIILARSARRSSVGETSDTDFQPASAGRRAAVGQLLPAQVASAPSAGTVPCPVLSRSHPRCPRSAR